MRRQVQASATTTASPEAVWAIAGDFCAPWHPFVTDMWEEAQNSARIRAFRVEGEDRIYRERLTYFSDTCRRIAYEHVQGIDGVESYRAMLSVDQTENDCLITMSADLEAPAGRAEEIADGTKAIFDLGVKTLAALAEDPQQSGANRQAPERSEAVAAESGASAIASEHAFDTITLSDRPVLSLSVTPDTDGPLVLFLHGIGGRRSNWNAQLASISGAHHGAALDLRGYGDSDFGNVQTTVEAYCSDILRVADALHKDRLILCGLSYGAWIATSFAMRHPEMLAGLILCGGCTGMSEAGANERDAFRQSREVPLDAGQTPADFAASVVDAIAGPKASDEVKLKLLASMSAISTAAYKDALTCFTNPTERFDFAKLTMPVLAITGEYDRLAPPVEIGEIALRICDQTASPDVQFEVIEGAGHVCNLEAPDAFNRRLMAFLSRLT